MSLHVHSITMYRWLPTLAVLLALLISGGCSLFPSGDPVKSVQLHRPSLPPIQTSRDAIQLEVFFVDRPADDPLLGQTLWREVDQIAAIPAETREILHKNGFQIGHSGSSPPQAIQSLLGLVADAGSSDNISGKPMVGLRKSLPPGIETELQASDARARCRVYITDATGEKPYEFDNARCVFRMKSARLRDGWIKIDFQPEIHHGELKARHTPTDEGWTYQNRQKIDVRNAQQFSLTMNVGEIAVITATNDQPESMGDLFFRHDDDGGLKQRLLIVRVADCGKGATTY